MASSSYTSAGRIQAEGGFYMIRYSGSRRLQAGQHPGRNLAPLLCPRRCWRQNHAISASRPTTPLLNVP